MKFLYDSVLKTFTVLFFHSCSNPFGVKTSKHRSNLSVFKDDSKSCFEMRNISTLCLLKSSVDFVSILKKTIPTLSAESHKGSSGRIAVLGGSEKYTGAPFYASMSALRTGADLATIYCASEASLPIKSYSPELMVEVVYEASKMKSESTEDIDVQLQNMIDSVVSSIDRKHAIVIGPGLGRDPLVLKATAEIIKAVRRKGINMVLDADALYLISLSEYKDVVSELVLESKTGSVVVLTPNKVEYQSLVDNIAGGSEMSLKIKMPGVIIIKKGAHDVIEYFPRQGESGVVMVCKEKGGLKRSGGIGDILAGCVGTFLAWNRILIDRGHETDIVMSCFMATLITKYSTKLAFEKNKRGMIAPNVLDEIAFTLNEIASSTIDFESNE